MPGSTKARASRVSRSIVQCNLPFAIWLRKNRRRQIRLQLPRKRQRPPHHPHRQFPPRRRRPTGRRNRRQSRGSIRKIVASPLLPPIHPARYQELSRDPTRSRAPRLHRQAANPQFRLRPCLNRSRRARHDFLRMNPTEIPLKSPGSVTDLSIGEVEQVERALIDASTRVPVQGVLQAAVNWWYANNLLFLWFGSLALATASYIIPQALRAPDHTHHLP